MDLQAIIYEKLINDPTVTAHVDDSTGHHAIYTSFIPEGVLLGEKVVIVVDIATSDDNEDTFSEEYRRASTLVRMYTKPRGSEKALVDAAEAVRKSLKAWLPGAVAGGEFVGGTVTGPITAPVASPDERGRMITLETLIKEI